MSADHAVDAYAFAGWIARHAPATPAAAAAATPAGLDAPDLIEAATAGLGDGALERLVDRLIALDRGALQASAEAAEELRRAAEAVVLERDRRELARVRVAARAPLGLAFRLAAAARRLEAVDRALRADPGLLFGALPLIDEVRECVGPTSLGGERFWWWDEPVAACAALARDPLPEVPVAAWAAAAREPLPVLRLGHGRSGPRADAATFALAAAPAALASPLAIERAAGALLGERPIPGTGATARFLAIDAEIFGVELLGVDGAPFAALGGARVEVSHSATGAVAIGRLEGHLAEVALPAPEFPTLELTVVIVSPDGARVVVGTGEGHGEGVGGGDCDGDGDEDEGGDGDADGNGDGDGKEAATEDGTP